MCSVAAALKTTGVPKLKVAPSTVPTTARPLEYDPDTGKIIICYVRGSYTEPVSSDFIALESNVVFVPFTAGEVKPLDIPM